MPDALSQATIGERETSIPVCATIISASLGLLKEASHFQGGCGRHNRKTVNPRPNQSIDCDNIFHKSFY